MLRIGLFVLASAALPACRAASGEPVGSGASGATEAGRAAASAAPLSDEPNVATGMRLKQDGVERVSDAVVRASRGCLQPYLGLGLDDPKVDRFVPARQDGRTVGLKAMIRPDGILSALGVRRGDILTSAAGIPLLSADDCMAAARKMRGDPPAVIEIGIVRNGKSAVLKVELDQAPSDCEFFRRAPGL